MLLHLVVYPLYINRPNALLCLSIHLIMSSSLTFARTPLVATTFPKRNFNILNSLKIICSSNMLYCFLNPDVGKKGFVKYRFLFYGTVLPFPSLLKEANNHIVILFVLQQRLNCVYQGSLFLYEMLCNLQAYRF